MSFDSQHAEGYKAGYTNLGKLVQTYTEYEYAYDRWTLLGMVEALAEVGVSSFNVELHDNTSVGFRAGFRCFIDDLNQAVEDFKKQSMSTVLEEFHFEL